MMGVPIIRAPIIGGPIVGTPIIGTPIIRVPIMHAVPIMGVRRVPIMGTQKIKIYRKENLERSLWKSECREKPLSQTGKALMETSAI